MPRTPSAPLSTRTICRLRAWCRRHTQQEAARRLGVRRESLHRWMRLQNPHGCAYWEHVTRWAEAEVRKDPTLDA